MRLAVQLAVAVFMQVVILAAAKPRHVHDSCDYQDPEFPFALTKLAGYRKILTIIHGVIMIWIFVFFIPVSVFPVFWHRLAPNERVGRRQRRKWLLIHRRFTYPVYPLLACSVVCAMAARDNTKYVLKNSSCSFYNPYHELLGSVCFLAYTFHFFLGFFSGPALYNDQYKSLRFYHSLGNLFAYLMSVPLMAMARVSTKEGSKRYLYIVPYFYFFLSQLYIHIRMKFADFGALEWHMINEAEVANATKGGMLRTSQWLWNFGFPSKGKYDSRLKDLQVHSSISRIRVKQFLDVYKYYWKCTIFICFVISGLMTAHIVLLHKGIYLSSANYFPSWHVLGDFYINWSLLEVYAL